MHHTITLRKFFYYKLKFYGSRILGRILNCGFISEHLYFVQYKTKAKKKFVDFPNIFSCILCLSVCLFVCI